jgi:hypothetical protein
LRTERIDRSKIDLSREQDVKIWLRHLATTRAQLELAIAKVGNSAETVRKELARMAADNSGRARGSS